MTTGRQAAADSGPFGYALAHATRAHRGVPQGRMAQLGLHLGQELLIVDLHHNPDTTQAELVQRIGFEQPTIAKALARMERAGFVRRTADPGDRRVTRLRLTDAGEAVVDAALDAWAHTDAQATAGLTSQETEQVIRLLTVVRDNLAQPDDPEL